MNDKHCADENRRKTISIRDPEKARCVSLNYELTVLAKNPGGDGTLNEHEREREGKQCRKIISHESAESNSPEVYFSR